MHYLDHNATSPLRPEARAAMERALGVGGNPSSVHGAGRAARARRRDARASRSRRSPARAPEDVIFTSGGTEANALALRGAVQGAAEAGERITRLFVSAIEHDSVLANAAALAERVPGLRLEIIPVTPDGVVDLDALRVAAARRQGPRARRRDGREQRDRRDPAASPRSRRWRRSTERFCFVDAVQAAGRIALAFDAGAITSRSRRTRSADRRASAR